MAQNFGGVDYHEHDAMPIRTPAYAQLLLDSTDRAPGQLPNDFTIYRNQALLYGYFYRLAITQLQFHYVLPTILVDVNNTFQLNITGGASATITLATGYYNPTTLAAAIQSEIQAAGGAFAAFTCSFVDLNGGLVVESNSAATFTFTDYNSFQLNTPNYKLYRNTARSLGLVATNYTTPSASQALGATTLLYTRYIDILSRNLTKYQRVKDGETDRFQPKSFIIARVYLTPSNTAVETTATSGIGSKPYFLTIDYNTPKFIKYSPDEALNEIDIQVLDEYGDPLYWDGESATWEFAFTLLASES